MKFSKKLDNNPQKEWCCLIVGTPPILFKGGGQDLPKIESLGGEGTKHFARKGDKPEKGGGRVPLFYYFTV